MGPAVGPRKEKVGDFTPMSDQISGLWQGLRDAGMPEVMLYLPDGSASRCHWDDTAVIGGARVALVADQERKIVRIVPIDTCTGIGVASPKGTDPVGHRAIVRSRLVGCDVQADVDLDAEAEVHAEEPEPALA